MRTDHLPFPMPERKHSLEQNWVSLTFMHWEVDPDILRAHVPEDLEIDLFDGKAYIGIIPFRMEKVRPRKLPSVPLISNFPEFNIRAYVTSNGKSGVYFLTLDAQSYITCLYAPFAYSLPYKYAKCNLERNNQNGFIWHSKRRSDGLSLRGQSFPNGPILEAEKNSLEEFLFERYCLYVKHKGKTCRAYTYHEPWKYRVGDAELIENTLTDSYNLGINNILKPDLVHLSEGVEVLTWKIEPIGEG